jgi:16S rRNA processing protein RimM
LQGEFVDLGEVIAAHGVKGEVKVDITTDSPKKRFGKSGLRVFLRVSTSSKTLLPAAPPPSQALFELTVESSKVQPQPEGKEMWILKFKGLDDRTQAEGLRGSTLVLPIDQRPPLQDPDEFYAQDLIGCHVFEHQGEGRYIGRVMDLFSGFGSHDTLSINLRYSKEDLQEGRVRSFLLPFVKVMVPVVKKEERRVYISPPEGLMEMTSSKKMRPLDEAQKAKRLEDAENRESEERERRRRRAEEEANEDEEGDEKEEEGEEEGEKTSSVKQRPKGGPSARKLRLRP